MQPTASGEISSDARPPADEEGTLLDQRPSVDHSPRREESDLENPIPDGVYKLCYDLLVALETVMCNFRARLVNTDPGRAAMSSEE